MKTKKISAWLLALSLAGSLFSPELLEACGNGNPSALAVQVLETKDESDFQKADGPKEADGQRSDEGAKAQIQEKAGFEEGSKEEYEERPKEELDEGLEDTAEEAAEESDEESAEDEAYEGHREQSNGSSRQIWMQPARGMT